MYNLKNKNILEVLNIEIKNIVKHNNRSASFKLFKNIENQINENGTNFSEELLIKINNVLLILKFISLYKFSDNDVIELLSEHFDKIFEIEDYDIFVNIDDFLTNYDDLYKRDKIKIKILKALSESKVLITDSKIKMNNNVYDGTVSNWLKDFRTEFTEDGFLDFLNINNYITSSKNYNKLNSKEKERIELLFKFYYHISKTSFNLDNLEDQVLIAKENGDLVLLDKGNEIKLYYHSDDDQEKNIVSNQKVFEPDLDSEKNIKEDKINQREEKKSVGKILESYKVFEIDLKSIDPIINSLEKYKNNPDNFFQKFNQDLKEENRDNLLANLVFICQNKLLDKFLKENEELLKEFKQHLSFKLSDDIIKNILEKSTSPETVSLYLQFLLFKKIKLTPKNAGLFGMHLANIFKKIGQEKYFPVVYADLNLERFVWREVIEENGLVKFK